MQQPTEKTLQQTWDELAAKFLAADGTDKKFPFNLAANEALRETFTSLSGEYLPRCEEKFQLLHEKNRLEKEIQNDGDFDDLMKGLDTVESKIKAFDEQLVRVNANAIRDILSSPGFPQVEESKRIATAAQLLSPLIGCAVASACLHSGYIVDISDDYRLVNVAKTLVPRSLGKR